MPMRWAQKQRLEYIDRLLKLIGHINRTDLVQKFEITTATASKDLQLYLKTHPRQMAYNLRAKRYEAYGDARPAPQ